MSFVHICHSNYDAGTAFHVSNLYLSFSSSPNKVSIMDEDTLLMLGATSVQEQKTLVVGAKYHEKPSYLWTLLLFSEEAGTQ